MKFEPAVCKDSTLLLRWSGEVEEMWVGWGQFTLMQFSGMDVGQLWAVDAERDVYCIRIPHTAYIIGHLQVDTVNMFVLLNGD